MFQACDNASTTTDTAETQAQATEPTAEEKVGPVPDPTAARNLPPIEPAIPDSMIKNEPQARKQVNMSNVGLDLNLKLPEGFTWKSLYGIALLCGVGFTMSLFIGGLAFEQTGIDMIFDERLGIIVGSLFSALAGYFVLKLSLKEK